MFIKQKLILPTNNNDKTQPKFYFIGEHLYIVYLLYALVSVSSNKHAKKDE